MSFNELNDQIDLVSNNSVDLSGKLTFIPTPLNIPDIEFEDDRIIMKHIIINGENGDIPEDKKISDEQAHSIVYGHSNTSSTEINEEKAIPESHPKMKWIKKSKKEVKIALKQLKNKGGELVSITTLLTIQIGSAAATIGSSAIVFPIGSGLPTAFSALMSIFAGLESFLTKLNDLLPILDKLKLLSALLPLRPGSPNPNTIIAPIIVAITTINQLLTKLDQTAGQLDSVKNIIPVPAGGVNLQGEQTSPDPINVELESEEKSNGYFKLKCTPSNGTWKYKKYQWSTSDSNETLEYSNTNFIIVRPQLSNGTIYKCEVTDSNDSKGSNTIIVRPI